MIRKIKLFFLRMKLKNYKRRNEDYKKIGVSPSWYETHGIPALLKEIFELENPKQKLFIWCPNNCGNELISSDSFVSEDDKAFVTYKCKVCGHESKWCFGSPVPILVCDDHELVTGEKEKEDNKSITGSTITLPTKVVKYILKDIRYNIRMEFDAINNNWMCKNNELCIFGIGETQDEAIKMFLDSAKHEVKTYFYHVEDIMDNDSLKSLLPQYLQILICDTDEELIETFGLSEERRRKYMIYNK